MPKTPTQTTPVTKRPPYLPPIWLALVFSGVGIVGMNLVYQSLTSGGVLKGIIGGVLLMLGVTTVGTPLAFARVTRKELRQKR